LVDFIFYLNRTSSTTDAVTCSLSSTKYSPSLCAFTLSSETFPKPFIRCESSLFRNLLLRSWLSSCRSMPMPVREPVVNGAGIPTCPVPRQPGQGQTYCSETYQLEASRWMKKFAGHFDWSQTGHFHKSVPGIPSAAATAMPSLDQKPGIIKYTGKSGNQLSMPYPQSPKLEPSLSAKNSFACFKTFASPPLLSSGSFQLLTPHHHLRTLASSPWPRTFVPRFQCRQENIARLHRMPCVSGSTTWSRIVIKATPQFDSASDATHLPLCILAQASPRLPPWQGGNIS
jgi:hypothetical protein